MRGVYARWVYGKCIWEVCVLSVYDNDDSTTVLIEECLYKL